MAELFYIKEKKYKENDIIVIEERGVIYNQMRDYENWTAGKVFLYYLRNQKQI